MKTLLTVVLIVGLAACIAAIAVKSSSDMNEARKLEGQIGEEKENIRTAKSGMRDAERKIRDVLQRSQYQWILFKRYVTYRKHLKYNIQNSRHLAPGSRHLASGYWLLVTGYWHPTANA